MGLTIAPRASSRFTTTQASNTRARVLFYDSGDLDAGSHTLIVTNDVEGSFFWIDSFIITEVDEPAPEPEPSPDPPSEPSPSAVITPSSSTSRAPATSVSQTGASSSTPRAADPSATASSAPQDRANPSESVLEGGIKIIVTTRDSTPSSGSVSPQVTGAASAPAEGPNVGAIVGGVLGGLIVILLSILVFIVMRRKARPKSVLPDMRATQPYTVREFTVRSLL
jgi:hypothetical protein